MHSKDVKDDKGEAMCGLGWILITSLTQMEGITWEETIDGMSRSRWK